MSDSRKRTVNTARNRRIVVKVGTALLAGKTGRISSAVVENIASGIAGLVKKGFAIAVVSSGAVGCGRMKLRASPPSDISGAQMLASVGQPLLMDLWMKALSKRGLTASQILCSADDFSDRGKFLNLRRTFLKILKAGIVPVINENDSVAVEEIKFGDNDRLSALVAAGIEAQDLVILTDVDGFYDGGRLVEEIHSIDKSLLDKAGPAARFGTGGMRSKLEASRITRASGCRTIIASGRKKDILKKLFLKNEKPGTVITASKKISQRKRWICFGRVCRASLVTDRGAMNAVLSDGKSLLAAGVTGTSGGFRRGDTVFITYRGRVFARGIVNYSSSEVEKISGKKSSEIERVLGYKGPPEVINRDDLVLEDRS